MTVAQDPPGSGKTYRLTEMMVRTDLPEHMENDAYSTFIVVTKTHAAKNVVYEEFLSHLKKSGYPSDEQKDNNNKKTVKFTKPNCAVCAIYLYRRRHHARTLIVLEV